MKMQRADWRVLEKASKREISIIGAFGDGKSVDIKFDGFDRRSIIERNIARGFIMPCEYFNKYKTTKAGSDELDRHYRAIQELKKSREEKRKKKGAA